MQRKYLTTEKNKEASNSCEKLIVVEFIAEQKKEQKFRVIDKEADEDTRTLTINPINDIETLRNSKVQYHPVCFSIKHRAQCEPSPTISMRTKKI